MDANAVRDSARHAEDIAKNLKASKASIQEASGFSIVSGDSLSRATALASTFYGIRKDIGGINADLGKATQKTNLSEFMRTNQFLDRVLENSRSRTREIVETYKNIRELPGTGEVLGPVENFARVKAWETYGDQIAGATVQAAKDSVVASAQKTKDFFYGDIVKEFNVGLNTTIDNLARIGLAIQGVQLLVGPLAAAWSAAFDAIIGQNIRLEQTILSTQTTLASTGRVIDQATGFELTDPLQKIQALEGGVRQAIDNIRIRSLDLAGVTSQQIIEIFGVVATSISQVNGTLKDAEDLAISFTAALGTLGIPFFQARQEIGSILGGYITEDSLLAKRLQISNQDIAKAKSSVDGVVGYLQKKLETAVAGQAIQARGFAGVTSNIQEIFEVLAQNIGAPLLEPLVGGLTVIYETLKRVQGVVTEVGKFLSTTIASTITGIANIFKSTRLAEGARKLLDSIAAPYKQLAFAIELGLGGKGQNLLQQWLNGTAKIPPVMEGIVNALRSFGNFLKLQLELITQPIQQLIDQTRDLAGGGAGIAQRVARIASIPFGNFIEFTQTFTMGWDTITTTIAEATRVLAKFVVTLGKLKITEFTAQIRAAAAVFEVFGSVLLGRLNLAISFFDTFANVAGSELAKFTVSLLAINKLINQTDFFGIKGIAIWAVQTRQIFGQLIGDAKLFVKGFKDAGNISGFTDNVAASYSKLFSLQAQSKNPVIANQAQIAATEQAIKGLNTQMAAQGVGAAKMAEYSKELTTAQQRLVELRKTQESFTRAQRATAGVQMLFGGGKEIEAAREAARQASVLASGAATARGLEGALEALRIKLGMTKEEFRSLGGAAKAAGKSIQTFITTTALINIGFTALSLGIAAGISWWQQYEERVKAARLETMKMASVNKILNSGWSSTIQAAEGGDVASQLKLDNLRSEAQAAISIQQDKQAKLAEQYKKKNDELYKTKQAIARLEKAGADYSNDYDAYLNKRVRQEKELQGIKAQQLKIDENLLKARRAAQLLVDEQNQVKDFQILSERRLDLESKIKQVREDFTKEVTDKEFQSRIDVLSTEQQIRREMIEQEKSALASRLQLLSTNSSDQEAKGLNYLQKYKIALLDAVQSEEQRRTELQIKQDQMRKAIEDYAFKMAREKIRLEKELGGYQKQMEQYKNKQTDIRVQKEVNAARQTALLRGPSYEPINTEQQQAFVNASQRYGIDHRDAFAMLNILGKAMLQLSGAETPDVAIGKLKGMLDARSARGMNNSMEQLVQDYITGPQVKDVSKLVGSLRQYAVKAFNTSRWLSPRDTSQLASPDLNIDYASMERRMTEAEAATVEATKRYQAAVAAGDKARLEQLRKEMQDASTITDLKIDYTSELEKASENLKNTALSVSNLGDSSLVLETELNKATQTFRARLRGVLREALQSGAVKESAINTIASGKSAAFVDQLPIDAATKTTIKDMLTAFNAAVDRIRRVAPQINQLNQLSTLSSSTERSFGRSATEERIQALLAGPLDAYRDVALGLNAQNGYSLNNEISKIRINQGLEQIRVLQSLPFKLTGQQLEAFNQAVEGSTARQIAQAQALDAVNTAVSNFTARAALAEKSSGILASAYKNLAADALKGGTSLKDAIQTFTDNVSSNFVDLFLEYAMKPIEDQLRGTFSKLFGVEDAQKEAAKRLQESASALNDAAAALKNSATVPGGQGGPDLPQDLLNQRAIAPAQMTMANIQAMPVESLDFVLEDAFKGFGDTFLAFGEDTKKAGEAGKQGFGKFLGAMTGVATGALAITGAIQAMQDSNNGTYGTLMGIAGILGGLGAITGGFAALGKRAAGGPVNARNPYVVGEIGPELFVPDTNGTIIPNNRLTENRMYLEQMNSGSTGSPLEMGAEADGGMAAATRAAIRESSRLQETRLQVFSQQQAMERRYERERIENMSAAPGELNIKYESQVINNVEYVTKDQAERMAAQSAIRGRELALSSLQNSVKTRKQVGMA